MARVWTGAAEGGHPHVDGLTATGSFSASTTIKRSGDYSYKVDAGAGNAITYGEYLFSGVNARPYYLSGYLWIPSASGMVTTAQTRILTMMFATSGMGAVLTPSGKLRFVDNTGAQHGSDSAATLTTDTWYHIELMMNVATAGTDSLELRLDGVTVVSESGITLTSNAFSAIRLGFSGAGAGTNKIVYLDDCAMNDDQGSSENTWPQAGRKVVCLLPATITNRASWTGGLGGTTLSDMITAMSTRPPAGTATETDTTQIESAASTVNLMNFDTDTFASKGIGASDTLVLTQMVVETGEDIATGTKNGTADFTANPSEPVGVSWTAGGDVGALGTYPTGWKADVGLVLYAPSVNINSGISIEFSDVDSSNRVQSVCFTGVMVEYIPAPPSGSLPATLPMWQRRSPVRIRR